MQQLKQEHEQLLNIRRQTENVLKNAKQAVNKHTSDGQKFREAEQRADDRVQELEAEISQDNINDSGVLEELHGQYKEAEENHQIAIDSYKDWVKQKDRIDEVARAMKQDVDKATAAVQTLEKRIGTLRDRTEQRDRSRHNALLEKNLAIGRLEEAEREKAEVVEKRATLADQIVNELTPQAEEVHSRVPVEAGMTTDMLDAKIQALIAERDRVHRRCVITVLTTDHRANVMIGSVETGRKFSSGTTGHRQSSRKRMTIFRA